MLLEGNDYFHDVTSDQSDFFATEVIHEYLVIFEKFEGI